MDGLYQTLNSPVEYFIVTFYDMFEAGADTRQTQMYAIAYS